MTKPDELLNVVIILVIAVASLMVIVLSVLVNERYKIYKLNKHGKKEEIKSPEETGKTSNKK